MVVSEVIDATGKILAELGRLGLILQALGIVVVLWIVFQVIALIVNRKRRKALYHLREDVIRLEAKIDRLNNKLEKKSR